MTTTAAMRRTPVSPAALVARGLGALLLVAMGLIHLRLYLQGYRTIAVIGPLFALNVVSAALAAAAVLLAPRRWLGPAVIGGALLAAGTAVGLVISVTGGLFGFTESLRAPLVTSSLVVEVAATVVLLGLALLSQRTGRRRPGEGGGSGDRRKGG